MSTQNVIKDINTRPETVQLLAGNIRKILPNVDVDNNFFGCNHQNKSKNRQMGLYHKKLLHSKGMMNKVTRQPME